MMLSAIAGVTDLLVPVRHRHLAGEDGGAALIAVVTDLEKVAAFLVFQRGHGEIVQYQHVDARKLQQKLADTAVGARHDQVTKQFRHPFV